MSGAIVSAKVHSLVSEKDKNGHVIAKNLKKIYDLVYESSSFQIKEKMNASKKTQALLDLHILERVEGKDNTYVPGSTITASISRTQSHSFTVLHSNRKRAEESHEKETPREVRGSAGGEAAGGGGGYFGGGGGAGSTKEFVSGGGGGGSGFVSGSQTSLIGGAGRQAANQQDPDYQSGIGIGGISSDFTQLGGGGDGLVVIEY
jgi:hypothetical protein